MARQSVIDKAIAELDDKITALESERDHTNERFDRTVSVLAECRAVLTATKGRARAQQHKREAKDRHD